MSKTLEELENKFVSIEANINLKSNRVYNSFANETELLNENYNKKHLFEKYSNELNIYRDGLLNQTSTNLRLEIDRVNIGKSDLKISKLKNLDFKRGLVKSAKICIWQLLKQEFKFNKIFSISELIKYKNYLGLSEIIQTTNESNDENILLEAMSLASQLGN